MSVSVDVSPDSGNSSDRTTEFVTLWSESGRQIYSYILSLLPNTHDADEVFSEVSRVLWEKFGEYRSGSNFRAWAMRIAYFKVLRYLDDRKHEPAVFDVEFLQVIHQVAGERSSALEAQYQALAECMKQLRPRDRQLLAIRYEKGATTQRAAEVLGRSADAIYKALQRIRSALFNCITARLAEEEL